MFEEVYANRKEHKLWSSNVLMDCCSCSHSFFLPVINISYLVHNKSLI